MSVRPLRWWITSARRQAGGFRGALPRLAQQARLRVGRERHRFADVDLRPSADAPRRRRPRSMMSCAGTISRRTGLHCRSASDSTAENSSRSARRRLRVGERIVVRAGAQQPHGHDHHVAIAGGGERRRQVRQGVRIAHHHQQAAGPRVDAFEREATRWQQLEIVLRDGVSQAVVRGQAQRQRRRPRPAISRNAA